MCGECGGCYLRNCECDSRKCGCGAGNTPAEDAASLVPYIEGGLRKLVLLIEEKRAEIAALAIARVATIGGAEHGRKLFTEPMDYRGEALAELADGAVYLATQNMLADPANMVKVSPEESGMF